ncbi:hypothetical protein ACLPHD_06565 [Serratia odorifera]|uniref:hypothetical protein n=1 Tax=Serratia odorifera TaxID=618 RepID=UPI003D28FFDF
MDNKLSELSKPVGFVSKIAAELLEEGEVASIRPFFDVQGSKPLYSQEYVSALRADNEFLRWRIKEIDLLFGQMLLTMQAAVIEIEHGEGPSAAMSWIVNKLMGPGEFAPDSEKDAQAYFNRESEKIDVEYSKCMDFFTARREAEKEKING